MGKLESMERDTIHLDGRVGENARALAALQQRVADLEKARESKHLDDEDQALLERVKRARYELTHGGTFNLSGLLDEVVENLEDADRIKDDDVRDIVSQLRAIGHQLGGTYRSRLRDLALHLLHATGVVDTNA